MIRNICYIVDGTGNVETILNSTPVEAVLAVYQPWLEVFGIPLVLSQSQPVCDIDFYNDPTKPQVPAKPDSALNRKLPGDELGPITTFTRDDQGKIKVHKKGISKYV